MLLINIPNPCHENWNEMSPREQGAFCSICSKTVIDFTGLSDEQVKNYFIGNRGQSTCGRFKNTQLSNNNDPLPALLTTNMPFWKKFLAIVILLFGSFLTGCDEQVVGKIAVPEIESQKINTTVGIILLDVEYPSDTTESIINGPEQTGETINSEFPVNPEIIELNETIGIIEVGEIKQAPDNSVYPTLEIQKPDSTKKEIPPKNECDSIRTTPAT